MIVVIDYGMGNLRSVSKALESLGAEVRVSSNPKDVAQATKLILPGVGAFPAAMRELSARRLIEPIKAAIAQGTTYLGICLGLQLLFETSEEGEGAKGLGVLRGQVKRFSFGAERGHRLPAGSRQKRETRPPPSGGVPPTAGSAELKVPHMGWNQVTQRPETRDQRQETCPLLKRIPEGSFVYFVHSYYADPTDRSLVALETDYGGRFAAMVWRKNLYATQFHPEKSQTVGLKLLENFVKL